MRALLGAGVLLFFTILGFSAANAEGGCGPGMHRGAYGRCYPNRPAIVVAPGAPVVVERPVVVAPRGCGPGFVWRLGRCRPI